MDRRSQHLLIFPTFFLDPSPYPLCIHIHNESVFPSIIHHVSLSIILSRLRIHLEAPGRHCVDIGTILCRHCRHWRFSADIADILAILCDIADILVYCVFIVCCEISSVYSSSKFARTLATGVSEHRLLLNFCSVAS